MKRRILEYLIRFSGIILLVIVLIVCAMIGGCKSVEYVPVESVREVNNEHYHEKVIKDTVREHTNTIIRQMDAEDSVYFASLGVRIKGLENMLLVERNAFRNEIKNLSDKSTDTLRIEEKVPVPYPVEKKLSKWEQLKIDYAGYLAMIALIAIGVGQYFAIRYIRQKK